jgi:hypothetical protein
VSRRARALGFAALALACAVSAAALAGDYRGDVEAELGELRPVVATRSEVEAARPLRPRDTRELLEVRRVPARFVPPDALADPLQAVGREPLRAIPAGSYLTEAQLRAPRPRGPAGRPAPGAGREAVEIAVTGAEALAASGPDPTGRAVDVVVTTEPRTGAGPGRTYVAADGVRLLGLREAGPADAAGGIGPAGPSRWLATVAARRQEALRLIHAHNYARELRLIGAGSG